MHKLHKLHNSVFRISGFEAIANHPIVSHPMGVPDYQERRHRMWKAGQFTESRYSRHLVKGGKGISRRLLLRRLPRHGPPCDI